MDRIIHPHYLWEDYLHGFYNKGDASQENVEKCCELLSDQALFWDVMCQLTIDWIYSTEFNLSNTTINRRAWLGQAACCYQYGIESNVTVIAWGMLDGKTQIEANKTANNMIELFKRNEDDKITDRNECLDRCSRTSEMDI